MSCVALRSNAGKGGDSDECESMLARARDDMFEQKPYGGLKRTLGRG
jgi:hypothetical protein